MSVEHPPMPTKAEDWNAWTLGDLYQFVQELLWTPNNDDRQVGLGPVLESVSVQIASHPWRMEDRGRSAKIVFLTEVNNLLAGRAPWTHTQTYRLWQSVAYVPKDGWDIAKDAIQKGPESTRKVAKYVADAGSALADEALPKGMGRDGLFFGAGALMTLLFAVQEGLIKRS